jgi:prepilin peptidase CpaA
MTLLASAPGWLAAALFLLLLLAAFEDLWRLQINDWVCGFIAASAFLAVAIDGPVDDLWENLLLFSLVLGLGTLLFVRGWMGGGDVKLLAASALWFDLALGWKMLMAVAIAGGAVAVLMMGLRRLPWSQSARAKFRSLQRHEGLPYGVAIAAGVIVVGLISR